MACDKVSLPSIKYQLAESRRKPDINEKCKVLYPDSSTHCMQLFLSEWTR